MTSLRITAEPDATNRTRSSIPVVTVYTGHHKPTGRVVRALAIEGRIYAHVVPTPPRRCSRMVRYA